MKFVIWGLKNIRHSHRYIHQGYFQTLKRMGYEVLWLDDKKTNIEYIKKGDIVFGVDVASHFLIQKSGVKYILHNFDVSKIVEIQNTLNIQVYTHSSTGENLDESCVLWNQNTRTLFQPWGISIPMDWWRPFASDTNLKEFWIGAIWNNSLNQGNSTEISKYKSALHQAGFRFKRVGGTRSFSINGIDDLQYLNLISKSPVGASIVGDWQRSHGYIPCRVFKSIAAGKLASSNSHFSGIFENSVIVDTDYSRLIDSVLGMSLSDKIQTHKFQIEIIKKYTYEKAISRILKLIFSF